VQRGEHCGRVAGEKFRAAVADGRPLDRVDAVRTSDIQRSRGEAREMIDSPSEEISQTVRFWLAYWAAFEIAFPEHEHYQ
jgi:hypothetical protein